MTRLLLLFLDGVGLGEADPRCNPFAAAATPALERLLGGKLLAASAPYDGPQATLRALDACLGVNGLPQSASGQAALLCGRNVPAEIGEHYGPKPNPAIAAILHQDSLFQEILRRGGTAALLNAYPPRYYESIGRGRRLYSAIPMAVAAAGLPLMTAEDLQAGRAFSADFTGMGWRAQPAFPPAPLYTPNEAGRLLAEAAADYTLSWFDYWPTDYAGHRGTLDDAVALIETLDPVIDGLVSAWDCGRDLIVITSDHGNLEDLSARGHTRAPVPLAAIGPAALRRRFVDGLRDLTGIAPAVVQCLFEDD